jgi:hypothetical protein
VLQDVRVTLLDWQASPLGHRLKIAEELCAAKFSSAETLVL